MNGFTNFSKRILVSETYSTPPPKMNFQQQITLYTNFVQQVVSQMLPLDRELFEEDYCMHYLERYAQRLNIPKPCNNPFPNDVCDCLNHDEYD